MKKDIDWTALVEQDRVDRSVYVDPDIFEAELEHIFRSTWIYIGHDSQIPSPGDYHATTIARQPVLMVRGQDDVVRVLYNRCGHKGAQVAPEGSGNARMFRCGYHGWIFRTDGSLRTIPAEKGYDGTCFDRQSADAGMKPLPRVDACRGFVFASMSADVPPLGEWLGGVASSIDNLADRAPLGRVEVAGPPVRYLHQCNWKFFIENLTDMLHPMVAHQSSAGTAQTVGREIAADGERPPAVIEILNPFNNGYDFFDRMGVSAFPWGHCYSGGGFSIHSDYTGIADYDAAMHGAWGAERTREILSVNRHNTLVYPSLTLKTAIQAIRVIRPLAVDRTLIETWTFRLAGAPDEMLQRTILYSNLINSPANLVGPEDHEAYRRLQAGLSTQGTPWVSMHRYLGSDTPTHDGGRTAAGTSDLCVRNEFKAWAHYMTRGRDAQAGAA